MITTEEIENFLGYLHRERQLSPQTLISYRRDLNAFFAYCLQANFSEWTAVTAKQVRAYVTTQHRLGLSGRSLQRALSSIRGFYRYLVKEGYTNCNPANDIHAPKSADKLPEVLDVDEMGALLDTEQHEPLLIRDHAIIELFYSSGLRLNELVSLDCAAINFADDCVRVIGKGRKHRIVPVGQYARTAIQRWLDIRSQLAKPGESALFVGRRGCRLTDRAIQKRIDHWAQTYGLNKNLHPHLFRHAFASHLLESSGDLRGIQELLGHADIKTTQVYTHLDFQHLAHVYDNTHPRAKKRG